MAQIHYLDTRRPAPIAETPARKILYVQPIEAEPPSRLERFFDLIAHTFGETPRGFTFFVGLLFPLAIAAFCAGYFGVRELAVML